MDENIKYVPPHIGGKMWIKGVDFGFMVGKTLFDCEKHHKEHGCEDCPKRGLRITVCRGYYESKNT